MSSSAVDDQEAQAPDDRAPDHKSKRFRFKRKSGRSRDHGEEGEGNHRRESHHRHHHHYHHRHHRSKRRKTNPEFVDDPSAYDDSASNLPPDAAFRESLFDALGDDEGADFWQGVYGQPIHTYPKTYRDQATGELEQMDDEEYAQYVRRRMWEKSWEGIEAAKAEKRREHEKEKRRIREEENTGNSREIPKREADYLFDLDVEQSLQRGQRRRDRKRWKTQWDDYLQRWSEMETLRETQPTSDDGGQIFLRNKIAWPVESGKRKDVNSDEVERFINHCAEATGDDNNDDSDARLVSILKSERVRWHPDKIQQRYGFMEIDPSTMQGVTAVFQVLDRMWSEQRERG